MKLRLSFRLFLASVLAVVALPTAAVAQFSAASYYHIKPRHALQAGSNLCLDVENVSVYNNARIQQWTCNPSTPQENQLWSVVPTGSGTFRIVSAVSAKCLDVLDPDIGSGAAIQQYSCNLLAPQPNQVFNVTAATPGFYRITSALSEGTQCLDVPNVSLIPGQDVQQWQCGPLGQVNQEWQIVAATPRSTVGHVKHFGWYGEDMPPASVNDHANTIVYTPGSLSHVASAAPYGIKATLAIVDMVTYKAKHADVGCNPALGPAVCDVTGLFANHPGVDGGLKPDICQHWAQQRGANSAYMPHVAAFYLDEPLWNLYLAGWNTADSLAIVQTVGEVLKGQSSLCAGGTTYPQDASIPFAVVEAYLTAPIQQPPAVDWVGFDCYGPFEDCSGPVGGITPWLALFTSQLNALRPHQKLVVVPSAQIALDYLQYAPWPDCEISTAIGKVQPQWQVDESWRSSFYLSVALAEPKVVAVWPWLGQSRYFDYVDGNGNYIANPCLRNGIMLGANDLPIIKNTWRYLARAIGFGNP